MTGYRLAPSTPTAASIARERADDWDAGTHDAGDVAVSSVDVVGRAGELVSELASLLAPASVYDGLGLDSLRTHQSDLARLSGVAFAATARAGQVYARAGGLKEDGTSSLLSHFRPGRSMSEARRLAGLARGTETVPATIDALAAGELSPDGAAVIERAVRQGRLGDNPADVERELLAMGRGRTPDAIAKHVKQEEQRRDGKQLLRDEERQHQMRRVSLTERLDGMWNLNGLLPSVLGEQTKVLLDALTTRDPAGTPDNEKRDNVQRTADAFADGVGRLLDHHDLPTSGGQARPHVNVTVDAETVTAELSDPDRPDRPVPPDHQVWAGLPTGQMDWATRPLSPQAVRKMCCDAGTLRVPLGELVELVLHLPCKTENRPQGGSPTGRSAPKGRTTRDRPIAWTEIHHVQWFRHEGGTDLDNGVSLCRRCHDLVHHSGWHPTLDPATASVTWEGPRGQSVITKPPDRNEENEPDEFSKVRRSRTR